MIGDYERTGPTAVVGKAMRNVQRGRSRFHQLDVRKTERFRQLVGSQSVESIVVSHASEETGAPLLRGLRDTTRKSRSYAC